MLSEVMVFPSISFSLTDQKVITNDTVRIQLPINATILDEKDEEKVRTEIVDKLKQFIDTDWVLSNPTRSADHSGVERLSLIATSRVDETENRQLEERLDKLNRRGLKFGPAVVDNSFALTEEEATRSALRINLLKAAYGELTKINTEMQSLEGSAASTVPAYILGEVTFEEHYDGTSNRGTTYAMSASYHDEATSAGIGGAAPSLGHSKKLIMTASITLWQASDLIG